MKELQKRYLVLVTTLIVSVATYAYDVIDGIYYKLSYETKTAEVAGGDHTDNVTIPSFITYDDVEYSVTSIGNYAFSGCSGLTSVTIPNSVTSIGERAFSGCSSLTSVTIPNSVTSIGEGAFYGCSGLNQVNITDLEAWCKIVFNDTPFNYAHHLCLNGEELKDLVIPNTVTSIGNYTFYDCSGLTSVTIPNTVTSIGNYTFDYCM